MDIHRKSVDMDMDMDVKFHIHGNPVDIWFAIERVKLYGESPLIGGLKSERSCKVANITS